MWICKKNISDTHVGKKVKCPKCKQGVPIKRSNIDKLSWVPNTQTQHHYIDKTGEDIQRWLKCPGCGSTFLPGSNHQLDSTKAQYEKNQKTVSSVSKTNNMKYIAVIGICFLAFTSIIILFIAETKLFDNVNDFSSSNPPNKLLNSNFLYNDIVDALGADDDYITDFRNLYNVSDQKLALILDEYTTVRNFVYIGLNKAKGVEVEWEKVDDNSWKIIYHYRGNTGSMVFSGKGGNETRYDHVTIDEMEFDRLPLSLEEYYDTINGKIVTYFKNENITKQNHSSVHDFADFIVRFFTDQQAQLTHIQFPLVYTYIGEGEFEPEKKTKYITRNEWKFSSLSWLSDGCCNILYFSMKNPESHKSIASEIFYQFIQTPEVNLDKFFNNNSQKTVIGIQGKESGINVYYYFTRLENKWMLVELKDLSM